MLRILLLPLILLTISMACMGQTFQYSRGWTNGKRSQISNNDINGNSIAEYYDDPMLERYLLQYPRYSKSPLLMHLAYLTGAPIRTSRDVNSRSNNQRNHDNNNQLYDSTAPASTSRITNTGLLDEFNTANIN